MNFDNVVNRAKKFAVTYHHPLQKYKTYDYIHHLDLVATAVQKYLNHVTVSESFHYHLLATAYLHDLCEDSFILYNDLDEEFGDFVADIVYACTSEKGKTRKQRFSDKFYLELRAQEYASFVKFCDRLVNVRFSREHKSSMLKKYLTEMDEFVIKALPTDKDRLVGKVERKLLDLVIFDLNKEKYQ